MNGIDFQKFKIKKLPITTVIRYSLFFLNMLLSSRKRFVLIETARFTDYVKTDSGEPLADIFVKLYNN